MPTFVEEGRYKDVSKFPVLSVVGSAKCLQEDLSSPELRLFSASSFTGQNLFVLFGVEIECDCAAVKRTKYRLS